MRKHNTTFNRRPRIRRRDQPSRRAHHLGVDTLGRDGEYITFPFETSDAANAAKDLFERFDIVELGEDENGRPMPPSAEHFAEARRIYLETAAQLELPDEEEGERQEGRQEGAP